jgi:hypothetical protein
VAYVGTFGTTFNAQYSPAFVFPDVSTVLSRACVCGHVSPLHATCYSCNQRLFAQEHTAAWQLVLCSMDLVSSTMHLHAVAAVG